MKTEEYAQTVELLNDLMDLVDETFGHSVATQVAIGALWMSLLEGRRLKGKAKAANEMEREAREVMTRALEGWPDQLAEPEPSDDGDVE